VIELGWRLRRWAHLAGLPGMAAAALAAFMVGHHFVAGDRTAQQLSALRAEVAALERQVRERTPPHAEAATAGPRDLDAFEARLPDVDRLAAVVSRLNATAVRSGLRLERADFKLEQREGDAFGRYVIHLPVQAEYRALRRFLRALLEEHGAIALDEITIRREDAKQAAVQAQLRLVVYVLRRSAT
jgi:hypothetical protein